MSVHEIINNPVDPDGRWLYRAGGVSALVLGIAYLVIIGLYVPIGAPPSGAVARLAYVAGNTRTWWAILGLSVFTDFLFVPVGLVLYLALKGVNRSAMLLGNQALFVYNSLTLAVGIFMTGFVMLSGIFSRSTAYLGLVTGILGMISVVGPFFVSSLSLTIIATSF